MLPWDDIIRRYRRLNGLTQAALAELLGVEQATVSRWERGFHQPDLGIQRRLRDMMMRSHVVADRIVIHRIRNAMSTLKLADRRGCNQAASNRAAALHGVALETLQRLEYMRLHTELLDHQWEAVRSIGFFRGEVASVRVINSWRPASGGVERFCEAHWTPVFLSDGEVMLLSEFRDIDEAEFLAVPPEARLSAVMVEELL